MCGPGGRGPATPLPPAARPVLQPKVKLRPFFWTKLPANKDNIWGRVQPPCAELELGQMAALEHLFAQAASTITPGRKKGADGEPLLSHQNRTGGYHLHMTCSISCHFWFSNHIMHIRDCV